MPCANCGTILAGMWCSTCGQKASPLNPTWNDLVHESLHDFVHLDGKIFRTTRKLFLEPGELTAELLRGRRAPYIGAIRVYLTFSLIYFLLTAIVPNPNPDGNAASGAPDVYRELARAKYVSDMLADALPKLVFVMVPVFALLLKLVFRRQRRNYPQYLYFALHFHAAVFGFLTVTVPLQAMPSEVWLTVAQACVGVGALAYLIMALKRVFGERVHRLFLPALAVSVSYFALLITAAACLILVLLRRSADHG